MLRLGSPIYLASCTIYMIYTPPWALEFATPGMGGRRAESLSLGLRVGTVISGGEVANQGTPRQAGPGSPGHGNKSLDQKFRDRVSICFQVKWQDMETGGGKRGEGGGSILQYCTVVMTYAKHPLSYF